MKLSETSIFGALHVYRGINARIAGINLRWYWKKNLTRARLTTSLNGADKINKMITNHVYQSHFGNAHLKNIYKAAFPQLINLSIH